MRRGIGSRVVRWLAVAAMCALPVQGFAGNGPAKQVVVAKSGGDFTSPIAAVNSITDASASNPYLVKVMPGVYDLGTASLVMKPYVYFEGSGDSSVITSAIVNTNRQCFLGTVIMANNSTLKDIRIENPGGAGADNLTYVGVVFSDVKAALESVSVYCGSNNLPAGEAVAVCSRGASADATLNNVILETLTGTGTSDTVLVTNNSTMSITNSRIIGKSTNGGTHVIDCHNLESTPTDDSLSNAYLSITNSYVEGNTPNDNTVYYGSACERTTITNSKLVASDAVWSTVIYSNRDTDIINTQIIAKSSIPGNDVAAVRFDTDLGKNIKISTSLIDGTIQNSTNVKLVYDFDGSFSPITNQ